MYPAAIVGFALVWYDPFTMWTTDDSMKPYQQWFAFNGPGLNKVEKQTYGTRANVTYVRSCHPGSPCERPDTPNYLRDQLFILPQKDNNVWHSARFEGKTAYACEDGKQLIMAAHLRGGTGSQEEQAGVWPAFWALGESLRKDVPGFPKVGWPACGEWDVFETTDGNDWAIANVHYGKTVDEKITPGSGSKRNFDNKKFNTWEIRIDRRKSNWKEQEIVFSVNSQQYEVIKGSSVGDQFGWEVLTKQPYFPVLNVAIGSQFPGTVGQPTDKTSTGEKTGMVVEYVAIYKSN